MEKVEIGLSGFAYPMPCALVGVDVNDKPNYLTIAWFTMVNSKPPYLGMALGKARYTNQGIKEKGSFSVNIPSSDMAEVTDYCGIVSGDKSDKAQEFTTFYGKLKTAPMIRECPYNLECRLVETVELPSNQFFIGEIVAAYADERYLTDGVPDMKKIDPFVLSMADARYFGIGKYLGKAWDMGKKFLAKKQ
ncbi:MAG: Flavoredoxin [Syntrophorhabdus sp. PtaU1.Bin050]|nr:MAG: Flavoredoxin [Syntrophorhabdus sp. PtaU1.Bin050]